MYPSKDLDLFIPSPLHHVYLVPSFLSLYLYSVDLVGQVQVIQRRKWTLSWLLRELMKLLFQSTSLLFPSLLKNICSPSILPPSDISSSIAPTIGEEENGTIRNKLASAARTSNSYTQFSPLSIHSKTIPGNAQLVESTSRCGSLSFFQSRNCCPVPALHWVLRGV